VRLAILHIIFLNDVMVEGLMEFIVYDCLKSITSKSSDRGDLRLRLEGVVCETSCALWMSFFSPNIDRHLMHQMFMVD
jgi:hypothetical protein